MRVAICMPVHRYTEALFTLSLAGMVAHSARHHDLAFVQNEGSTLAKLRCEIADKALDAGAEYLLWLDSDHTFPVETLELLLGHGLPVVGCNYPRRKAGAGPCAIKDGKLHPLGHGLEAVDALGFGVCLIRADVLEGLPRPWFDGTAEDVYFFRNLREAKGIVPVVDNELSARVGHMVTQPHYLDPPKLTPAVLGFGVTAPR